jgi:probable HAF family extracellular repeat protein
LKPSRFALTAWLAVMLVGAGLAATAAPAAPTTYTITDLGSLGYGVTDGYGINANGQVTGGSYTASTVQISCPPRQYDQQKKCFEHPEHAFLWSGGTMNDLGTLGGINSEAHTINLSATVAGWSNTKSGGRDAFVKPLGKNMVDLGALEPLAGWESRATGINDFGEVVGWFGFSPGSHAWLYSNGKMTELPDLSSYDQGGDSSAGGINNNHQIVGSSYDANGNVRAVLWQNGTITDLGTLGGPSAAANAINNLGQIVGTAATSTGEADFLDSNGTMTNGATNTNGSQPTSVNGSGVFVDSAAFIYSGGTLQNLNNLIPAGSPYQLTDATGMNDKGQIVVQAYDTATFQSHTLLLTPS